MKLVNIVKTFLNRYAQADQPLILALSGGADSTCLLHLLLENRTCFSSLHIAHVDHKWRPESSREAAALRKLSESLGLSFHLHELDKEQLVGNLEDACRGERIAFFIRLAKDIEAQAVVLGHHADDQAETVLKRVFEGASLVSAGGMREETERQGVRFWRPLLSVSKNEILNFLKEGNLAWFEDSTNADLRFLRSRMRQNLIPLLNHEFGKNLTGPLCRLGGEAQELHDYLTLRTLPFRPQKIEGPFGTCYDFSHLPPAELIEWKFLIKKCCREQDFPVSHEKLNRAAEILQCNGANKEVHCGGRAIAIDRGKLFFLTRPSGEWKIETNGACLDEKSDWTHIFRGRGSVLVPRGAYRITSAKNGMIYHGSSTLGSWWSKNKVPVCIRGLAPVLIDQDESVHEFLTGKSRLRGCQYQRAVLKFEKLCC